jgi:transcriptional regulator
MTLLVALAGPYTIAMYIPRQFKVEDRDVLFDFMARNNFATLITAQDGAIVASHLLFIVKPDAGDAGMLVAHMARANGQWQALRGGDEALVIFQGPHAYVSPSWYETHPSVPTWNYMTVHAYCTPRLMEDEADVRALLHELVAQHEEPDSGWTLEGAEGYVGKMIHNIVAFELRIVRLEGKAKLSQNRDDTDRGIVREKLLSSEDGVVRSVGELMQQMPG